MHTHSGLDPMVCYLITQGAELRVSGQRLVLTKDDEVVLTLPARRLSHVVVVGNVTVTQPALVFALKLGVDLSYISVRGTYYGGFAAPDGRTAELRVLQAVGQHREGFGLELARTFVAAKIENQRRLLLRRTRDARDEELGELVLRLTTIRRRIRVADDIQLIRGLEGIASRMYFTALTRIFPHLRFDGRSRRPPRDPGNALLSFGYALLERECRCALHLAGLDPAIAHLHSEQRRENALALDLMEELRVPAVDATMLGLAGRKHITEAQFEPAPAGEESGGVWLTDEGRRIAIEAYERRMRQSVAHLGRRMTYRDVVRIQSRQLAGCYRKADAQDPLYRPFLLPV